MNSERKFYSKIDKNINFNKRYRLMCLRLKESITTRLFILKLKRGLVKASRGGYGFIEYKYVTVSPYVDLRAVRAYFAMYFNIEIEETNFSKIVKRKVCQIVTITIQKKKLSEIKKFSV